MLRSEIKERKRMSLLDSGPLNDVRIATQLTFIEDDKKKTQYILEVRALNKAAVKIKTRLWLRKHHPLVMDVADIKEIRVPSRSEKEIFRPAQLREGRARFRVSVSVTRG